MSEKKSQQPEKELVYIYPAEQGKDQDEVDLFELCSILWRGRWFIVGLTLLCTLAAFVSAELMTPRYKASATLRTIEASKEVIRSYLQSDALRTAMLEGESEDGGGPFALTVGGGGKTLQLEWIGTEPSKCSAMLSRVLQALREYMENEYIPTAQEKIAIWKEELDKVRNQLAAARGSPGQSPQVIADIAVMHSKIAELRVEALEARTFTVASRPSTPQAPFKPNTARIAALTFVVSLFASIFLVFFWRFVQNIRARMGQTRASSGGQQPP
jgi:LPS O-antigen subunit length determinant protein (WzzB/FepE family)